LATKKEATDIISHGDADNIILVHLRERNGSAQISPNDIARRKVKFKEADEARLTGQCMPSESIFGDKFERYRQTTEMSEERFVKSKRTPVLNSVRK
jgi:hypothetical protein